MTAVIPGLFGTPTFELSVTIHAHHHDTGEGVCAACGHRVPCAARRSAAAVMTAAGREPGTGEARCLGDPPRPPTCVSETHASYDGLAITGRARRLSPAGFHFERDVD